MTEAAKPPMSPTAALAAEGVSIWLDDLSRERILSGGLQRLVAERNVVGVTTNPTIFAAAVLGSNAYDEQIAALAREGRSTTEVVFEITTEDVARAADVLRPTFDATGGVDGWVSIEVGADAAHDAQATTGEARQFAEHIDRPNVFVKIPATVEGLTAIADSIALGISVNVTLIFSLERYGAVIDAYLSGLERAHAAGIELRGIHSVASFFVSRVDTEVDRPLKGSAGIANARLAY
jgi:transaldolase